MTKMNWRNKMKCKKCGSQNVTILVGLRVVVDKNSENKMAVAKMK